MMVMCWAVTCLLLDFRTFTIYRVGGLLAKIGLATITSEVLPDLRLNKALIT